MRLDPTQRRAGAPTRDAGMSVAADTPEADPPARGNGSPTGSTVAAGPT